MPIKTQKTDVSEVSQSILDFEPLVSAALTECKDSRGREVKTEAQLRASSQDCHDIIDQAQTKQLAIVDQLRTVVEGGLYKSDGTKVDKLGAVCHDMEMSVGLKISYAKNFSKFYQKASECAIRISTLFAKDPHGLNTTSRLPIFDTDWEKFHPRPPAEESNIYQPRRIIFPERKSLQNNYHWNANDANDFLQPLQDHINWLRSTTPTPRNPR